MIGGGRTGQTSAAGATGGGGGVMGVLGSIIGGIFSARGQRSANRANRRLAKENRDWQERMSNTAYQRSANDLDKAGLNRILALGSPASTPQGNVATMQNVGKAGVEGIQAGLAIATTAKLKAETANIKAKTNMIQPASKVGSRLGKSVDYLTSKLDQTKGYMDANLARVVKDAGHTAKTYAYGAMGARRGGMKPKERWANPDTWQQKLEIWYENQKAKGKEPTYEQTKRKGEEYLQNQIGIQRKRNR